MEDHEITTAGKLRTKKKNIIILFLYFSPTVLMVAPMAHRQTTDGHNICIVSKRYVFVRKKLSEQVNRVADGYGLPGGTKSDSVQSFSHF